MIVNFQSMRGGVHDLLFGNTILTQGTEAQVSKYSELIQSRKIIGCFGMVFQFEFVLPEIIV